MRLLRTLLVRLRRHRLARAALVLAVSCAGIALGLALFGSVRAPVGPVQARLSATAGLSGGVSVRVPPLGSIALRTHRGPLHVTAEVRRLDPQAARQLVDDPTLLTALPQRLTHDVRRALLRLALTAGAASLGGAAVLGLVVYRSWRRALLCAGVAAGLLGASVGVAAATLRRDALSEPTYSGLLANAPGVIGSAEDIAGNLSAYGSELSKLVGNVSRLYAATSTLPLLPEGGDTTKVLLVSDIHLNPSAWPVIRSTVEQYKIDLVVDAGDLTDHGSSLEDAFAAPIGTLGVPYVYVKGNHDSRSTTAAVDREPGTTVLRGQPVEVEGIRFLGGPDPRFTPDQTTREPSQVEQEAVEAAGDGLAETARSSPQPVDVAVVHDPVEGARLDGAVPLVLSGHTHKRAVTELEGGTTMFTQGSTGGAGLRGLEGESPTPVELSVLYLDRTTHRLAAYDDITLGGLGLATATVERHVVPVQEPAPEARK
ncbi:Icc-related predicted phosphoesterase [Motilibacter peucedani]|uniref:Icc-related predicted phosphoesterase n=1 Tax=Motilibacter peucedani TaxID=598650 RepID=A0A420XQV9_9ACTN|nr:metallophosphoesterase [Motilibacter peucedani]RKS75614.1 Icc-related predicted phosphoesterase [Motilibacter peucedani]